MSDLKELIATINKKYGENTLGFSKDLKFTDVERITSGSLFLDYCLGVNLKDKKAGFPMGRIVELFGPPSSGKSLISMKTVAEAQKNGMTCAYIDCENSYDKDFAALLGVDNSKLLLSRESMGEDVIEIVAEMLRTKQVDVIVIDSVASMIPKTELEDDVEKAQMALAARMMGKAMRKLTALNEKTLLIFINQLRMAPGVIHGNPEYTPGGKSLGFFASIRVAIRRGDWIEDEKTKEKLGQNIKFKVEKNKTAPPMREGYMRFIYGNGQIDKIDEIISLGLLNSKIERKGAYFYIGEEGYQGREALEEALRTKPELFNKLKDLVLTEDKKNG